MIPLSYNVRNLIARRATTVATAGGIGLVVFVLAAALMLQEGLRKTLDRSGQPDVAIVVRKGADSEMPSGIDKSYVSIIASAPGVAKYPSGLPQAVGEVVVVLFLDLANGQGKSNVLVRGVPDSVFDFRPEVRIIDGSPPRAGTDEVIVGKRIRGRFQGLELGGQVEMRKNRLGKVVGIFEAGGSSFESEVWGDLDFVADAFGRTGNVSTTRVRLESPEAMDGFEAAVESDPRMSLDAMPEPVFYVKQSENTGTFIMIMGTLIAVCFSAGAMIGAMITMYGAVSQRRREIGILRALGFPRGAILLSFLLESILLATLGGLLGVGAALLAGFYSFSMMNFQTFSEIVFDFEPTPSILGISLVFGVVMGVVGGFLPALRAARTSALEAMRG